MDVGLHWAFCLSNLNFTKYFILFCSFSTPIFRWWNRKPGNSGKRYATRQDERDYDKAFKEWYQREVVEGGRKMYTLDNKLIEPLPYHTDEAHAVFLKVWPICHKYTSRVIKHNDPLTRR